MLAKMSRASRALARAPARLLLGAGAVLAVASCSVATEYKDLISGGPLVDSGPSDAGDAEVLIDGATRSCPSGMVLVNARSPSFCIDATEVTVGQYEAFLPGAQLAPNLPPFCATKVSFVPMMTLPDKARPAVGIDWCDAASYCFQSGKRLCGAPNGGTADISLPSSAAASGWFAACSGPNGTTYPYGSTFDPSACNGAEAGSGSISAPRQFSKCEGGYAGLFDMSGNVAEWENSCNASQCRIRGGSSAAVGAALSCAAIRVASPLVRSGDVGFRCCTK